MTRRKTPAKQPPRQPVTPPPKPRQPELYTLAETFAQECRDAGEVLDAALDTSQENANGLLKFLATLLGDCEGQEDAAECRRLMADLSESLIALKEAHVDVSKQLEDADGICGAIDDHFNSLGAVEQYLRHLADPYQRNPFRTLEPDKAALEAADILAGEA